MKNANQYYLFKAGLMVGPVGPEKLESLRASGELAKYSWIMDDLNQTWQPVITMPGENPFQKTQEVLNSRDLSGTFVFSKKPYLGMVKGIHSFGIELIMDVKNLRIAGLKPDSVLQMNLADETNAQCVNAQVVFQSAEDHAEGVLLRFGWLNAPAMI
jgi:hypothetical protein